MPCPSLCSLMSTPGWFPDSPPSCSPITTSHYLLFLPSLSSLTICTYTHISFQSRFHIWDHLLFWLWLMCFSELQLHPRDVPKGSIFWRYTCFIQTKFYFCREQDQEMQKLKMLHLKFQDYPLHPISCQSVPSLQKPQVRTYRVSPPPRTSDSLWQCRRMFKITYNLLSAFKAVNSFMSASTMK